MTNEEGDKQASLPSDTNDEIAGEDLVNPTTLPNNKPENVFHLGGSSDAPSKEVSSQPPVGNNDKSEVNAKQEQPENSLATNDIYPQPSTTEPDSAQRTFGNTDQVISEMNQANVMRSSLVLVGIALLIMLLVAIMGTGWYLYNAMNNLPEDTVAYELDGSRLCYWVDGEIVTSTLEIVKAEPEIRTISVDDEEAFIQEAQDKGWCITKVTTAETDRTVTATRVVDSDVPQSNLKITSYPVTSKNPAYELLFFPDTTSLCNDATGYCGQLIANIGNGESVHLIMNDLSKYDDGHVSIDDDSQCEDSNITAQNAGSSVNICEAGFGGKILYYKFQLELGTNQHVGTFSGINPKGQVLQDISSLDSELVEIIESLKLL